MPLVDAVTRVHKKHVAVARHTAGTHVVLGDSKLLHHVEDPDNVRFVFPLFLLGGIRAIVFAVAKAFGIEALHFATAGHVPEPISFDQRCAADSLQRPIVHATSG